MFIKCKNKTMLLMAGETIHVANEFTFSLLNTEGIVYNIHLLRPSKSGRPLFSFSFFFSNFGGKLQAASSTFLPTIPWKKS